VPNEIKGSHKAHVVHTNGKDVVVAAERGQISIDAIQMAGDGQTAGWLVLYTNPDGGSPFAGRLVLLRAGKIIRRFQSDQTFWSWAFYGDVAQPLRIVNFTILRAGTYNSGIVGW
jgi:hypothetical protein